ncbi:MAG TPA: VWA domain-containing protein, partial [Actinomycetes bacterium]|nr:VWA domain-containing protein [Actinomycetes bacterium]
ASRPWKFGDEEPIDVVRTVRNAVLRGAAGNRGTTPRPDAGRVVAGVRGGAGSPPNEPGLPRVRLSPDDFEVTETEYRTSAAVCLLIDQSYSMLLRDAWGMAKATALALHSLMSTSYPQDALSVIGFSRLARTVRPAELPDLAPDVGQGTNLQHALMLAGRHLDRHPEAEPVVLVVTDGEPTAHLEPGGMPWFEWPPDPRTIELTLAEVVRLTRRGATINVFMLDEEPRLVAFVDAMARLNGGRVFAPAAERLGEYVVSDYLRSRRARAARR